MHCIDSRFLFISSIANVFILLSLFSDKSSTKWCWLTTSTREWVTLSRRNPLVPLLLLLFTLMGGSRTKGGGDRGEKWDVGGNREVGKWVKEGKNHDNLIHGGCGKCQVRYWNKLIPKDWKDWCYFIKSNAPMKSFLISAFSVPSAASIKSYWSGGVRCISWSTRYDIMWWIWLYDLQCLNRLDCYWAPANLPKPSLIINLKHCKLQITTSKRGSSILLNYISQVIWVSKYRYRWST